MHPHWTSKASIPLQSASLGLDDDMNQGSQTSENVDGSWRSPGLEVTNHLTYNPGSFHEPSSSRPQVLRSHFRGPEFPLNPVQNTPDHRHWDSPISHQVPGLISEGHSNDTSSCTAPAQTYSLPPTYSQFLPAPSADLHHAREQPSLPQPLRHNRVSVPLDQPGSSFSSKAFADDLDLSSLVGDFNTQAVLQDDNAATTSSGGQLLDSAPSNIVGTREQDATTQGVSRRREQKLREKRERDKERKRSERSNDSQVYSQICSLLRIPLLPRNTLPGRILSAVEELVEWHEHEESRT